MLDIFQVSSRILTIIDAVQGMVKAFPLNALRLIDFGGAVTLDLIHRSQSRNENRS